MKKLKAQSAVELIGIVAFALFILISFLFIVQNRLSVDYNQDLSEEIDRVASMVVEEVSWAVRAGSGFSRSFVLPPSIYGQNYSLTLQEGGIYVNTTNGKFAVRKQILNASGILRPGTNNIRNFNGSVFVNT